MRHAPQLSRTHTSGSAMLLPLLYILFLMSPWSWGTPLSLPATPPRFALHLPLYKREAAPSVRRRAPKQDAIGLGDDIDITYNVLIQVGETLTPLVLDTGSSDLWVLSSSCSTDCFSVTVPLYPQTSFQPSGLAVRLAYGDSQTGTYAQGPVGKDVAGVASLRLQDQYIAAILETNTSVLQSGSAGIFGLGFPVNSVIWNKLLVTKSAREAVIEDRSHPSFGTRIFPDLSRIRGRRTLVTRGTSGGSSSPSVGEALASFATNGPLLPRLILTGALASPIFAISLQRDTVDIGGNQGMLSIGELPAGIAAENLTWVPLRGYTVAEGGLPAPEDSPNEVYPITWEVAIDDVYFDGRKLPRSALATSNITLTALLDTGNSLIRGPRDVLDAIIAQLGGNTYKCAEAHTLAFQIGGNLYPVDPRDFGSQTFENTVSQCTPNLAVTDPPGSGFLYSWSIGDPFLKSVFAAFYYGNLTHPSQDQPRIGLLSTVPSDAAQRLQAAVQLANATLSGNFPVISEAAPSGSPPSSGTGVAGVPQAHSAPPSQISHSSGATSKLTSPIGVISLLTAISTTLAL
ncbi:acid protease [Lactarius akahatsu]|uniref:Acid protease n=1 Tax=Lactarius akahatsu TaxID=416441 RepID=A0AAD4LMZ4_9AGAM|nr:acid protease [Lactarius akahatsu]